MTMKHPMRSGTGKKKVKYVIMFQWSRYGDTTPVCYMCYATPVASNVINTVIMVIL